MININDPYTTNNTILQANGNAREASISGNSRSCPHGIDVCDAEEDEDDPSTVSDTDCPHAFLNTENMAFPFNATLSKANIDMALKSPLYAKVTICLFTSDRRLSSSKFEAARVIPICTDVVSTCQNPCI